MSIRPQRIVVLGADGQLGTDLCAALAGEQDMRVFPFTILDFDVTRDDAARTHIGAAQPDAIINTTAYVRVDDCEEDVETCFRVNALAARSLAKIAAACNSRFVHFSTDYVFGGDRKRRQPYTESDPAAPLNVYGASKLAGEHLVLAAHPRALVIRTCGLYGVAGATGKGGNFVETMIKKARTGDRICVVDDQRLIPSFTVDVAQKTVELLRADAQGLYHVTNAGDCSWFEFAEEIFRQLGLTPDLGPTTSADFKTPARRPSYSVLANKRLLDMGLEPLRAWQRALACYLEVKGHSR